MRIVFTALVASGICFGLTAPGFSQTVVETKAETAGSQLLPAITMIAVRRTQLSDRVFASGFVVPKERIHIQPQINGQAIDALMVEVGDTVEAGQVLAKLSTSTSDLLLRQLEASRVGALATIAQSEAQLIDAEASRDEALRVQKRMMELSARGAGSTANAEQAETNATGAKARVTVSLQSLAFAKAQLRVADARIADAKLQLKRTEIKAPFSGIVEERNATLGGVASSAGQPMFVLVRDGILELHADVAEQDLLRVMAGQPVAINAVGLEEPISGAIDLVEPSVNENTRLGTIRISISEPDKVRSGMYAAAEAIVVTRETLAVPISAVGHDSKGDYVYIENLSIVGRLPVETGIRDGGLVEIINPELQDGDLVIHRAGVFVRPGDRINPVLATVSQANE